MFTDLQNHLTTHLHELKGDWVRKSSAYELDICLILSMDKIKGRYWDAQWGSYFVEFKKGTSIWLDLVRYSEILLRCNDSACQDVLSLFFVPSKSRDKIIEVVCVDTQALIGAIKLTEEYAVMLRKLASIVPRSLNAQVRLTLKDLRRIKQFSISS